MTTDEFIAKIKQLRADNARLRVEVENTDISLRVQCDNYLRLLELATGACNAWDKYVDAMRTNEDGCTVRQEFGLAMQLLREVCGDDETEVKP